jgi:hypothetical protein
MCGSDEPHPYRVRVSTYRIEQVSADEVQKVMVYSLREYVSTLAVVIEAMKVRIRSVAT